MTEFNNLDNDYILLSTKFFATLESFFQKKAKTAIFGAGTFGEKVCTKLQNLNYPIECFFDNNKDKENCSINNIKIFNPKKLSNDISLLLIASTWYVDIITQLKKDNLYTGDIIVIDPWFDIFNLKLSLKDAIKLNNFYLKLSDNESKNTLIHVISSRFSLSVIKKSSYSQYFNPNVRIEQNEVFLDGGSYIGDTVLEIEKEFNGNLEIHCFEPENDNYENLLDNCKESKNKLIFNKQGLWSTKSILKFSSSQQACALGARIESEGDVIINTISIDEYCIENNVIPNFIKLDVEGVEKEVLLGAKETIKNYKPKLAIAIYHKYNDLWDIPNYLNEIYPFYNFYLGHHSDMWYETILYAIAKND